jgi:hypothetical protein
VDVYVEVTAHARERAVERFPEQPPSRDVIVAEVLSAIADGRMATKLPRWCVRDERRRARGQPWIRFLWNEERTRVYPVDRRQRHVTVITVIRPSTADTRAA